MIFFGYMYIFWKPGSDLASEKDVKYLSTEQKRGERDRSISPHIYSITTLSYSSVSAIAVIEFVRLTKQKQEYSVRRRSKPLFLFWYPLSCKIPLQSFGSLELLSFPFSSSPFFLESIMLVGNGNTSSWKEERRRRGRNEASY